MKQRLHTATFAATLALGSTLLARAASAQTAPDFTGQYQTWIAFNYQGPLRGNLFLAGDVQYRAWDNFTPQAIIVRNALLYRIMDGMFVGGGYMWQPFWRKPDGESFTDEHRLYQTFQYQYTHAGTGIAVQFRTRLEERFRYPAGPVEFGLRVRQLVRGTFPVTSNRRLFLVAWDEVFFNLTDSGHEANGVNAMGVAQYSPQWETVGFDQNRAFAGVGYQFVPNVFRAEIGYMNQYQRRPGNAAGDLMGHTTLLQLYTNWR